MCGIAGVLGAGAAEETAAAMAAALAHRGPDDAGTWADAGAGLALGHTRLAVIDLSPAAHQPMHSADGRWVLVFNGEIYNFRALRERLVGTAFRGHSDTEVLVEAIAAWGPGLALARLSGMFAFAAWDRRERRLHLARDRLGEKPLYYGRWRGGFLFASELQALHAVPGFSPSIDRRSLASFLRYSHVPAPWCIYEGLRKLEPGTCLSVQAGDGSPSPRRYWQVPWVVDPAPVADETALVEEADRRLREAVRERMVADVPLGAFLSGGIDSSTVSALMQAESGQRVRTFSIGFEVPALDEAPFARAVARHLGTDHTEVYVSGAEALEVVPRLAQIYDEPFADSSQIPTALICAIARRHVTVALSGDGGDELFGGYHRHFLARRLGRMARWPASLRAALAALLRAPSPAAWDRMLALAAPLAPRAWRPLPQGTRVHKLADLVGAGDVAEVYRRTMTHWRDAVVPGAQPWPHPLDETQRWHGEDPARVAMYLDAVGYLPDDILTKVDRASMAVGLEVRVPFLDHALVEWSAGLPVASKIRAGRGKWLLRRVLARYVPPALTERAKMGFGVPLAEWLRGPLREWAQDLLAADRLGREGLLDAALVRQRWAEHLGGRRDWHYALWDVLMFESWLQRWQRR